MDKSKWEYKKLGEVCDAIYSGGTPKRSVREYWNGDIPWIKISDLNGSYVSSCDEFITKGGLNNSSAKLLPKGTILYSIFATIGAIGILDINATTNQAIAGIIVKKEYNREYIFYVLRSLRKYFEGISKGVAQNNINLSILKNVVIPIPSSSTQQQIVSELDQLNELISLKQQQLKEYDALAQSIFYEMFFNLDYNWPIKTIGELASEVKYGTSKAGGLHGKYKYLRMNNLTDDGHLDLRDLKYIDLSSDDLEKYVVRKGDILFNRTNSREKVGKTALYWENEEMVIAGYIIRVRIKEEVNPIYLVKYMNTPYMKRVLRKLAKGAVGQANINAQQMQSIHVPVPPLNLQINYAERIEAIERQKALVKQSIAEVQTLLDSRMQEYFG